MGKNHEKFAGMVKRLGYAMDILAGICLTAVMILIVGNILLRQLLNMPVLGAYEMVGYLTAIGISFALASCALQKGHISLDFVVDKLPGKLRRGAVVIVNALSFCFWILSSWHLIKYGQNLMATGIVSPTAQVPVYLVAFLSSVGFLGLSLVSLERLLYSCRSTFFRNITEDVLQPQVLPQPAQGRR